MIDTTPSPSGSAAGSNPQSQARVGDQTGGRVFIFLETDDFWREYHAMTERGVVFSRPPSEEPYGTVAVLEDLYGTKIDLIQRREPDGPPASDPSC